MPHGSRNLQHLGQLQHYDVEQLLNCPMVIAHDQEPLIHGFYKQQSVSDFIHWYWQTWHETVPNDKTLHYLVEQFKHDPFRIVEPMNSCDRAVLLHSELHSAQVDLYRQDGYAPVYYWNHALLARDWFRYAEHDPRLSRRHELVKFLVLSRAWSGTREYRLYVLDQLRQHNLLEDCTVTFGSMDNGLHHSQHVWCNPDLAVQGLALDDLGFLTAGDAACSADYDTNLFAHTSVDLVLETLCDDPRIHLTEKTLRPLACGRPFLLLAGQGSLAVLRNYGFETFGEFIDESYDSEPNHRARIDLVIKEMHRLSGLHPAQQRQLVRELVKIARRNQQHFFSNRFVSQVVQEYQTNMTTALDTITSGARTHMLGQVYQLLSESPEHLDILQSHPLIAQRYRSLSIS